MDLDPATSHGFYHGTVRNLMGKLRYIFMQSVPVLNGTVTVYIHIENA